MIKDREIHVLAKELSIKYSNYFPGHPLSKFCLIKLLKVQNLHDLNTAILTVSNKLDKEAHDKKTEFI